MLNLAQMTAAIRQLALETASRSRDAAERCSREMQPRDAAERCSREMQPRDAAERCSREVVAEMGRQMQPPHAAERGKA